MKKLIDKRIVAINVALIILGIVFGIVFLILTSHIDKLLIKNQMGEYFDLINKDKIVNFTYFFNSFKMNFLYILIITICSIVFFFSPIVLFINFYKGMQIGFLLSSTILTFKIKGIILGLLLLIPHHIVICILLIIYSSIMLKYAYNLFKITRENKELNIKLLSKRVLILFGAAIIICLISTASELFINRFLLKLAL